MTHQELIWRLQDLVFGQSEEVSSRLPEAGFPCDLKTELKKFACQYILHVLLAREVSGGRFDPRQFLQQGQAPRSALSKRSAKGCYCPVNYQRFSTECPRGKETFLTVRYARTDRAPGTPATDYLE